MGARQDDVSQVARVHGLAWSRAKVGALENGEKAISAEELMLLPLILSKVCQRPVRMADLIPPDVLIRLSSTASARGSAALKILAGAGLHDVREGDLELSPVSRPLPESWPPRMDVEVLEEADPSPDSHEKAGPERRELVAGKGEDQASDVIRQLAASKGRSYGLVRLLVPSETERKAAKRLDETPETVLRLSRGLWGLSLAEERDRLVDERADAGDDPGRLRALRGRITRQLVDRLAEEIQRGAKR
ncbi:hypothetical protein ND748_02975 [Frankia sp. AiPs1]|uniref:hypothetical protein n=1 Tax=Frankia sp. AiPs1 TaxID=573493 RepID=UPI0020432DE6|nr:hypothetical protein [Frankia sp. AiPs1]MCM3920640.1 hypothetical protein [Frankia sp. AiPs1]